MSVPESSSAQYICATLPRPSQRIQRLPQSRTMNDSFSFLVSTGMLPSRQIGGEVIETTGIGTGNGHL